MRRSALAGPAVLLMLSAIVGCSTAPEQKGVDESLDVYGAKKVAQEVETELASFIPADVVASSEQLDEGALLSCSEEGAFQWSGHTYLTLNGELDSEPVVDAVAADFSERASYSATRDTTQDGAPGVHVHGADGAGWLMTLSVDRTRVEILSFSPCFRLAEGLSPRDRY